MGDSPMLTADALEAANDAAFQARNYTEESVRAFLAAQDRAELIELAAAVADDASRYMLDTGIVDDIAKAVVNALLGPEPATS